MMKATLVCLLAGTAMTMSVPALAQEVPGLRPAPDAPDAPPMSATPEAQVEPPAPDAPPAMAERNAGDIVVVGSRGKPRTDVDRPVPVDVVSNVELRATGQTDLGQQVQFSSPSFSSSKYGVNGATNFADPASLRGLAPDQVLVLVNGKRRHQFSALNLNVAPGLGTVVTDLNSIPTGAVKRIEVLRDGAAAQYGSDAIAGIVNLALNDQIGGTIDVTGGIHKEGDGFTNKISLNHGLALGSDGGFVNYTLEYFGFEGTNRSDTYTGALYPATPANYAATGPTPNFPYSTANPRADRNVYPQTPFVVGNYGSNRNRTYQAFLNASYPIAENTNLYTFGGYSRKDILAYGFFRSAAVFTNSALGIFPDGYVPKLPGTSTDWSATGGINSEVAGWKLDFSVGYGMNKLDQNAYDTVNASLGNASPTNFYVGRTAFNQWLVDLNASKDFGAVGIIGKSLNVAWGTQFRRDNFIVTRGSPASYAIGPLAASGKAPGTNGRPGYAPADENNVARHSIGYYVDAEAEFNDALLVAAAVRFEDYSDFGSNISGKLAGRYKFTDAFALRGSYNRGFRAPSLQQTGNRVNTSTVQNNQILITQQVSSDDPRLAALGVPRPKAEISNSYSLGITGDIPDLAGGRVSLTIDAFQIDITDRIVISEGLLTAQYPAVRALFPEAREIRFFTNQIDTRTRGIDVVATYKANVGEGKNLTLTLAGTHAKTDVQRQRPTPAPIIAGASAAAQQIRLLGETATELIEVAQPRTKILASANYAVDKFNVGVRASYFGNVKAFSTGLSGQDKDVKCDASNRCVQTFRGKTLTDVTLTYAFTEQFSLTVGANNIFDIYPDKWKNTRDGAVGQAASYSDGQTPYTRNASQFGFNGSYYFVTANVKF
ncbi:MAG: TonB-dependent receptor [Sphingomonas adhaesiva]|uniref:TonB-dependent receptor plug domain-containing protein n=1 Tax=Sphingomonas adhaesiva TaxID=28212 RepID=UPI002FF9DE24